ncbi:MAG: ATP-grasp domain-containing protein [Mesorhizobium sp.]|uniref:ATP-grasp domain-containing protein n=1 Tax=Mesorhizobium sp. M7A.F.Ca.ET.027.02.1.1 TaxID=2496655 RepID=UPI000FD1E2F2|nr:acetyl-CoA carboxylase biotin carboxylase subunit family protein [Mesorhizobium sp. M7A.F.Ca.ET.027.02.1.1]RVD07910.1 ATP-grasp domain-containing protein [Mesorhizobium sp. M7A.F.Ca.ET.027.02.1.1]RWC25375.1 MAG: ATP-grasp domain-containing protein [Mesorhizobium sp.]RWD01351.1 MAG: ATP-grasp domain-containing protein [Mesorhizobium sp.]
MARRALVMLEAASNSLRYVQAARSIGLHPITLLTDKSQYQYLHNSGSEVIFVEGRDVNAFVHQCSKLRMTYDIAGITSPSEEVYATVGYLCRHFNLPGPNPVSIERCCKKFTQRRLLGEAGVPIPAYRVAANTVDVENAAAEIGLPVVVKPAVGVGSSGVRLCRKMDELCEHTSSLLARAYASQSLPRILVEEFARGSHYSIELMGNEVIGVTAADFGDPPHFVCRQYVCPAPLAAEERKRIVDISLNCLQALGLGWGPANIDLRWTRLGPVVIEVNPRLAGAPNPQLIELAYGIDLIAEHIKLAIGEGKECPLRRRHSHVAAARILVPDRDGTLDWISGESRAAAVQGVAELKFDVAPLTPIVRKGDYRDRIGYVVVASPTPARTKAILQRAVDLINWSITPFTAIGK